MDIKKLCLEAVESLKSKYKLPENGYLTGSSLSNTMFGILNNTNIEYDDVDIFILKELKDDTLSVFEENTLFVGSDKSYDIVDDTYDGLPAIQAFYKNSFSIDRSIREGDLNMIYYTSNTIGPDFIKTFDLNCTQISYNLSNGDIFYTEEFEEFIKNNEIIVNNLRTPIRTFIRYFKKCADLSINPCSDTIKMISTYIKLNNIKSHIIEKSYNKFIVYDTLKEYFKFTEDGKNISNEVQYKVEFIKESIIDMDRFNDFSNKTILICPFKFPKFWKTLNKNKYLENIYMKLNFFVENDSYVDIDDASDDDIELLKNLTLSDDRIIYNLMDLKLSEQINIVKYILSENDLFIGYTILCIKKFKTDTINKSILLLLKTKAKLFHKSINSEYGFKNFKRCQKIK